MDQKADLLSVDVDGFPANMLEIMMSDVAYVNRENGWYDHELTMGDDIALLHSEISEAFEAYRDWEMDDMTGQTEDDSGLQKGLRDADGEWLPKPEGVASEIADELIRVLDFCYRRGIDLSFEYQRKMRYNRIRGYHHGGKKL